VYRLEIDDCVSFRNRYFCVSSRNRPVGASSRNRHVCVSSRNRHAFVSPRNRHVGISSINRYVCVSSRNGLRISPLFVFLLCREKRFTSLSRAIHGCGLDTKFIQRRPTSVVRRSRKCFASCDDGNGSSKGLGAGGGGAGVYYKRRGIL